MSQFVKIAKALADETRVRALSSLIDGELCLCVVIELLGLAPSSISKHMNQLMAAGLVQRRKVGRWHYYRIADDGSEVVKKAIDWTRYSMEDDPQILYDRSRLAEIQSTEFRALCHLYKTDRATETSPMVNLAHADPSVAQPSA